MHSDNMLRPFFAPEGVMIVGARRSPGFGFSIPTSLIKQGWGDRIYLVNPVGGELHGKKVYESVSEVPDPVDLAIVIVPSPAAPGVLEDIGTRGVKCVILETAGFAEIGEQGMALQKEVEEISKRHGIRIIGPNCVGVVNTDNSFASVETLEEALEPGPVSVIAQSGMFGTGILDFAYERGLYISKVITLGNRMDVDECEVMNYLSGDPTTKAIMMYLESASNGPRLLETLDRVTREKPVLILKSGRTSEGKKATESHTGSLSGEDEIYEGAFAQHGAVRAENIEELMAYSAVFSTQPLPAGNRLGIVTSSGSMGVMSTDTAVSHGLDVPAPSAATIEKIKKDAPGWMNVKNPLDTGPSQLYGASVAAALQDPNFDMVMAITIIPYAVVQEFKANGIPPEVWFGDMKKLRESAPDKPFVICSMGNSRFVKEIREIAGPSTPVIFSPNLAAKSLAALWDYARRKKRRD